MQTFIINFIISSLEKDGLLKKLIIKALRALVSKTTNTIDDRIIDLIEDGLNNKKIDPLIHEALAKVSSKI